MQAIYVSNRNQNKNFAISRSLSRLKRGPLQSFSLHSEPTEMGCGESKHIATGNTISRKNSRAGSKKEKASAETIEETSKNDGKTSSIMVKEGGKNGVADGKDNIAAESTELKKNNGVVKGNEEPVEGIAFEGIPVGSDEHKSAQQEAGKESLLFNEDVKMADALEVKTLAEETKAEAVQDIKLAEETKNDSMEDKKLAEDAKEVTVNGQNLVEEKKEETAKGEGEPETVKGENTVKETESEETTEAEVSTPDEKK